MCIPSIQKVSRHLLAQLPTPIVKVDYGWNGRPLFVKRDDLTGSALSGNKVRKLEYLIADARSLGADTLVTCGGVQSNCARALAVAAAMTGFRSMLVLTGCEPADMTGNLLLNHLVGSDVHIFPNMNAAERDATMEQMARGLRARGRKPYVVPFGGSSDVGAFGYVQAALETAGQLDEQTARIAHVVTPMASGGTYAGLYIGCQLAGLAMRPVGAFVEGDANEWPAKLVDLIQRTAARFGLPVSVTEGDIELIDARGAGYAQPTADELEFIVGFARQTGLILDPVYTGKAMYALERDIYDGEFTPRGDVLFLHTGGTFGIFPYSAQFTEVIKRMNRMPAPYVPVQPTRRQAPYTVVRRDPAPPIPAPTVSTSRHHS
jgi:D-cysteine desulfhydrase